MTSHIDKGQLFGTDGHVTWTEPELPLRTDAERWGKVQIVPSAPLTMVVHRCAKCGQVRYSLDPPYCAECQIAAQDFLGRHGTEESIPGMFDLLDRVAAGDNPTESEWQETLGELYRPGV